jgi:hypothetical protein
MLRRRHSEVSPESLETDMFMQDMIDDAEVAEEEDCL